MACILEAEIDLGTSWVLRSKWYGDGGTGSGSGTIT
tara:strand:- start:79 stop:186 length:108 start_codon:yes stop_codon:yes gene_type:complete